MRCVRHPDVETNLRCGKCETPICPRCMVETPVGARCQKCARINKIPTYRVSTGYYLRAIGAAIGIAIGTGVLWAILSAVIPFLYVGIIIGGAVGYACAEVISLAVNRKRGKGLAVIAGFAVALSYLTSILVPWGSSFYLLDLVAIGVGIFAAVMRIR
jgi:hypothetical protein